MPDDEPPGFAPTRRCPSCGRDLLPLAPACPACGPLAFLPPEPVASPAPTPTNRWSGRLILVVAVAAIAFGGAGALALDRFALGGGAAAAVPASPEPSSSPTPGVSPSPADSPVPEFDPVAAAKLVELPKLTVDIDGVDSVEYYPIQGTNPDELDQSMRDDGPAGDHPAFEGYQDIAAEVIPNFDSLEPTFSVDRVTGSCRVTGLTGTATYRAVMPQWVAPDRVPAGLLAWWEEVLEHIRWHEEQHVRLNEASIERLRSGLDGQPCPRVDAITTRWANDLNEAHLDFDRDDDAWLPPLYPGPWEWDADR